MTIQEIWQVYRGVIERKEQLEDQLNSYVVEIANFVSETRAMARNVLEGTNYKGYHYRGYPSWELTYGNEVWVNDNGWEISFPPEMLWMDGRQLLAWREEQLQNARQQKIGEEQAAAAQKLAAERAEYKRLKEKFG